MPKIIIILVVAFSFFMPFSAMSRNSQINKSELLPVTSDWSKVKVNVINLDKDRTLCEDPNDPDYHQEDWQSQLELYDYLDGARDGNEVLSRMADLRDQSIAERRQADTEEYGADYVAANPELYRNEFRDELNSNLEMAQIKSLGQLIDTIKPDPQNPNKWRQRERQLTRQYGRQRAQAMLRQEAGIVERPDNN